MKFFFFSFFKKKYILKKKSYLLQNGIYYSPIFSKGNIFIKSNIKIPEHLNFTKLENYFTFQSPKLFFISIIIFFNDLLCTLFSSIKVNNSSNSNYVIAIITNQSDYLFINLKEHKIIRFLNSNVQLLQYNLKRKIFENYINSVPYQVNELNNSITEPLILGKPFIEIKKKIKILEIKKILIKFKIYNLDLKKINNDEIIKIKLEINKLTKLALFDKKISNILGNINILHSIESFKFIPCHTDLSYRNLMYYENELIVIDFPDINYFPFFYDSLSVIFLSEKKIYDLFLNNVFEKEIIYTLNLDNQSADECKYIISNYILFFIIFHAYRKVTQLKNNKINLNDFKKNISLGYEKWYLPYVNKNNL